MNGMEGKNRAAAVMGLGAAGTAAALLLASRGWTVTGFDDDPALLSSKAVRELCSRGIELAPPDRFPLSGKFDLTVASPGVPPSHPLLRRAAAAGIPVLGEVELASRFLDVPFTAVTGTNGKTTTTALLEAVFRRAGRRVVAAGNNGVPLSRIAADPGGLEEAVVELSSFQIERLTTFRPRRAVLLNLAPDHLDRHGGFAAYAEAKLGLFSLQRAGDVAVFPESLRKDVAPRLRPGVRAVSFGEGSADIRIEKGEIVSFLGGEPTTLVAPGALRLRGGHNLENVMAAAAVSLAAGVGPGTFRDAAVAFAGLPHRLELVGEADGVSWWNDSKATNPHAVAASLAAFPSGVVWIAGGRGKAADFAPLRPLVRDRVRLALYLGEAALQLAEELGAEAPWRRCASLEEAVVEARRAAGPGDRVVLAPGCASFDMFKNYRERGDRFRCLVEETLSAPTRPPRGEEVT